MPVSLFFFFYLTSISGYAILIKRYGRIKEDA